MKTEFKFFGISFFIAAVLTNIGYADTGSNPYSFFNAQNSSANNSDSSTADDAGVSASPTSSSANVQSLPATTSQTNPGTQAVTTPAATSLPANNKRFQYVEPASQVGKTVPLARPVTFTLAPTGGPVRSSASTSSVQSSVSMPSQSNPNSGIFPDGFLSNLNSYLQQIANNTGNIQSTDQQLTNYWTAAPSSQSNQILQSISGYSSSSNLNTALTTVSAQQSSMLSTDPTNMVSLTTDWSNVKDVQNGLPYLQTITQGNNITNPITNPLWIPAVNTALFNLSVSQPVIQNIGQTVNTPFSGQSATWLSAIQSATAPQLLQALVIGQAIQNELAYQILQRQQDQEIMQASQLSMLAAINKSIQDASSAQLRQEERIITMLYNLSNSNK